MPPDTPWSDLSKAQAAVLRDPGNPLPWRDLGEAHLALCGPGPEHYAEVVAAMKFAVDKAPESIRCVVGMAAACSLFGDDANALMLYRRARDMVGGKDHLIVSSEACALFRMGRWNEGWVLYEDRLNHQQACTHKIQPGGLDAMRTASSVLVLHEQGNGDCFQFSRYVPELARVLPSAKVWFETPPGAASLMRRVFVTNAFGVLERTSEADARAAAKPDFTVSVMSLPLLLGRPVPGEIQPMRLRYGVERNKRATGIGLCRAGNPYFGQRETSYNDRRRSVPEFEFYQIMAAAGDRAVNLHAGTDGFDPKDWLETAQIMLDKCALVISVDTAVAHLAASLGIDTWLLNRFDSCWRWGLKGETTPWYPSMRIFRQPVHGDWASVIGAVAAELRLLYP